MHITSERSSVCGQSPPPLGQITVKKKKMSKMTIVQLGVLVFAICLSTQVASDNSTDPTAGGNSTSNPNATMATGPYSNSNATTNPTGAGVTLHAGTFSFLIPFIMAASLVQLYC